MFFTTKEETLVNFLLNYYKTKIELFSDIIYQKTPLSLRLLDWLVTNYSKKFNVMYPLTNTSNNETVYFNIYLDYKNQLKAYSKKFFDPFCRQKRLIINCVTFKWNEYKEDSVLGEHEIVTTIGQLNFFRWFIDNKILNYALANIKLIDADMINTIANKKKGKRTVLSPSAVKGIYTNTCAVTLKFKA